MYYTLSKAEMYCSAWFNQSSTLNNEVGAASWLFELSAIDDFLPTLVFFFGNLVQEAQDAQPGVLIFCDDASVEKAASSAVHKFNENLSTGNQLALFQILSASKVQWLQNVETQLLL